LEIKDPARRLQQALFPAVELLAGMAIAQAVALLQVHLSNRELLAGLEAAAAAGYLPVPNRNLWPELAALESAFHGGLFFTLSAGAALALAAAVAGALAAAYETRLAPFLLAWAGLMGFLNAEGVALFPTLYALLVPPAAFALARRGFREGGRVAWREVLGTRLLPIAVLALCWFSQYDRGLFTAIRDRLLLSNPVGQAVHDYYYRWTLYPAEAFKSPAQKQIRTVWLRLEAAGEDGAALAAALAARDVLPLADPAGAHFEAEAAAGRLRFRGEGRLLAETTVGLFLAQPEAVLEEVYRAADRLAPFRRFIFFAVLLGFPTALYCLAHALIGLPAALLLPASRRAGRLCAVACLALAALAFVFFVALGKEPKPPELPPEGIAGLPPARQAGLLGALLDRGREVTALAGWEALARSPDPRVRRLLARGLGASRSPEAPPVLERLIADPQLAVRTAAIEALARRDGPSARRALLAVLHGSHTWYDQFYAYRALRSLGWKQTAAF